ncbi:hypothetical protein GCM10020219_020980 [Nonomuraea dietziae]
MQAAKQMRLSRKAPAVLLGLQAAQVGEGVDPAEAELRLVADGGDVVDGGEGLDALVGVGQVGVEQRQVELHVHRLLEQLPRQVQRASGALTCW